MEPLVKTFDLYMIKSLFLAGHDVVICDETNYSRAARDHMRDESWETVWYPVPTDATVCIERAYATNQADLVDVIREMAERWQDFEAGDEMFVDVNSEGTIVTTRYRVN
jgi:predicted kinase